MSSLPKPDEGAAPPPLAFTLLPLLAFAAVAGAFRIRSVDTFWHLAAGRWILEHRRLPNPDPLRFTAEGEPWIDHEWLFQVVLAVIESLGGLTALGWFRIAAVLALAGLLWAACRRLDLSRVATSLTSGAAVFVARPRFFLRPELLTLVALALFLLCLIRYRQDPRLRWLTGMVVLTVFWANCHPGVLMAPVLAAGFQAGSWIGSGPPRLPWFRAASVPLLVGGATLVNPAGFHLWLVPLGIAGALEGLPGVNPEWLPMWERPLPGYFLTLGGLLLATVVAARRRRPVDLGLAAVAAALAILASSSLRHLAPFAVGAALYLASLLGSTEPRTSGTRSPLIRWLPWAAGLAASLYLFAPPTSGPFRPLQGVYAPGFGLVADRYPEAAVDFVEAHPEIGRLYNNVAYGGYLLWRLYPPRQIFNDGRNELDPTFLTELAHARSGDQPWRELFDRYDLAGALVRYDFRRRPVVAPPPSPGAEPVVTWMTSNEVLFPRERFALVHWDDVAMVFLVRRAENAALIDAYEYRWVRPEDAEATLRYAADPEGRRGVLRDLQRRLKEDPGSRRASQLVDLLKGSVESPPALQN